MEDQTERRTDADLTLDTATYSGVSIVIDAENRLSLQHGGTVTRLFYDKVEDMPLAYFAEKVAPGLAGGTGDDLYALRDIEGRKFTLLKGSRATRYHLIDIDEVGLDRLLDCYKREEVSWFPYMPWPIVAFVSNGARNNWVFEVKSFPFLLKMATDSVQETYSGQAYTPDMWIRVTLDKAGNPCQMNIAVVLNREARWEDTKLYRWPLGNTFVHDGSVCQGTSTLDAGGVVGGSDADRISAFISRIFYSTWNHHILPNQKLNEAWKRSSKWPKMRNDIENAESCLWREMLKTACILADPNGLGNDRQVVSLAL